jgi:protein disulfide-isomerase A6
MKAVGALTVAAADCDEHKQIGAAFGLKGFPTIVATLDGKLVDTYGGGRTAPEIAAWGLKLAAKEVTKRLGGKTTTEGSGKSGGGGSASEPGGGKNVVTLTGTSFGDEVLKSATPWLVEFYAPWCGHCKALAPEWARAADSLAKAGKGVKLGAVDCTAHESLCAKYDVKGYPTILVFGRDKSKPKPFEGGGRKAADIIAAGEKLAVSDGAPIVVPQLLSGDSYADACSSAGRQACVLTFLPHILDAGAAGRNKSLAVLSKTASAFAARPWGWLWTEGGAQPALEAALGVAGYPAVALLNYNKGASSLMRSSFSEANVKDFLELLPGAAAVTAPAAADVLSVDAWDGKDAAAPEMEDEFDLDDLMGGEKDEL